MQISWALMGCRGLSWAVCVVCPLLGSLVLYFCVFATFLLCCPILGCHLLSCAILTCFWLYICCPGLQLVALGSLGLSLALCCHGLSVASGSLLLWRAAICSPGLFLAVLGWHMLSWAGMGCPGLSWALLGLSCALMSSVCCLCFSFGVGAACVVSVCI